MASEHLLLVSTKAVRAVRATPAVRCPLLFSQGGHRLSMAVSHLKAGATLVTDRSRCEFSAFFFALRTAGVQCRQVRPWFSDQIRSRLTSFRSADFCARLRAHLSSAASTIWRFICQRPRQALTCQDPSLLGVSKLFVRVTLLKYNDLVHQPDGQESSYPTRLRCLLYSCQDRVSARAPEPVARLTYVSRLFGSRVDEHVDDKLGAIGHSLTRPCYAPGMMVLA